MSYKKLFSLVLLLLLASASFQLFAISCELSARISTYAPKKFKVENRKWSGLEVQILDLLSKNSGLCIREIEAPWARSLRLIKSGQLDLMLNLSRSKDREEYIHFIGPYGEERMVLMVHKTLEVEINTLLDFRKIPNAIGREKDSWYGRDFQDLVSSDPVLSKKVLNLTTHSQKLELLKARRIDAAIVQQINASYMIKNHREYSDFKLLPFIIHVSPLFIGASKVSVTDKQVDALQSAVKEGISSGELPTLWERYRQ